MKQFIYIVLMLVGFQSAAFTTDDSTTVISPNNSVRKDISGGSIKKIMGNRVYMRTNNPRTQALKCTKNPKIICAYVSGDMGESGEGDPTVCPDVTESFIPEPYYSMQFNPQKFYIGIPDEHGGIKHYEVNTAEIDCSESAGENGSILIKFDPPLDLEQ